MQDETNGIIEERVASLFQPDVVLSTQYFETLRRKAHLEPEKRLMLAVLEDAIVCFQSYMFARDSKRKGLFRAAEEWISQENDEGVFSFDNICEAIGFSPQYVRQGLLRWKERKMAGHLVNRACHVSLETGISKDNRFWIACSNVKAKRDGCHETSMVQLC